MSGAQRRGLGFDNVNNVELAQVSRLSDDIRAFRGIFGELCGFRVKEDRVFKQNSFLFSVRLLSLGAFYHQWQGSLGTEVRFKLSLSEEGKRLARDQRRIFGGRGYDVDTDSISRDPLGIEKVFQHVPKPFPREFTRMFTVDTILGRWVPLPIAKLMDDKLDRDVQPYVDELKQLTSTQKLALVCGKLSNDTAALNQFIHPPGDSIESWKQKARRLAENRSLIKRLVYRFERLPEPLADLDRELIFHTFSSLKESIQIKGARGKLKRELEKAIASQNPELQRAFKQLAADARAQLDEQPVGVQG